MLAKEISDKLERAILKDIIVTKGMSPLEIVPL